MAVSCKVKFAALLLFALLAISVLESTQVSAVGLGICSTLSYPDLLRKYYGPGTVKPEQCPGRCAMTCSKTKHRFDFCNAGCMSCCYSCKCVPPSTSGYREVCPCYDLKKTKKGGPKCP
ncbi:hypothetical protein MKW98_022792 [Papaver atlanticum]|uniref:Uncharacterized protein n=1 Tax=Papaver atlanticum TaxID=357466 RepID=A0AAD4XWM9_9MAGN|nr:hypothetical protein MKW98_022792 [Papaver atlanticum]